MRKDEAEHVASCRCIHFSISLYHSYSTHTSSYMVPLSTKPRSYPHYLVRPFGKRLMAYKYTLIEFDSGTPCSFERTVGVERQETDDH